jgi:hypothetical protein
MTVNGNILTGGRALGLVGEFAGHVLTGSGVGRGLAAIPGHVITGAGHFVNGIQEYSECFRQADVALRGMQDWANNLQANLGRPILIPTNAPRDLMLAPRMTQRNIILLGDVESRAWDSFMDSGFVEQLKEMALTLGSVASGDLEAAVEHGVKALELGSQQHEQAVRHLRDVMAERAAGRPTDGIVRDTGMIRHSGN